MICHVTGFHPPDISITLEKNGVEIPDAKQTDLVFKQDWHFHLTKNVGFTPVQGDKYTCKVTHGTNTRLYAWGKLKTAKVCVQHTVVHNHKYYVATHLFLIIIYLQIKCTIKYI